MTRGALGRAARTIIALTSLPTGYGEHTGESAQNISLEEACRLERRIERLRFGGQAMSLAQLVHKSRQRARARVTKPGKR